MTLSEWRSYVPKSGQCVIVPAGDEVQTGSIIRAERYQPMQGWGEVLALNGIDEFGIGDSVVFKRWAAAEIDCDDGRSVCIVRIDDVEAVIC